MCCRPRRQSLLSLLGAVPGSGAPITFQVVRSGVTLPEVYTVSSVNSAPLLTAFLGSKLAFYSMRLYVFPLALV